MKLFASGAKSPGSPESAGLPSRALLWPAAGFALLLTVQWDRLPLWLAGTCILLALWRWLAQSGRVGLPGRWVRAGIMLVLTAAYVVTVDRKFTVDTAASFFVLSVGLKWLETRSLRDFYVLFFILVYLATVNFLFHQEIFWTLVNLAAIGLLLMGLQVVNAPDLPAGIKSGWRRLGRMLVQVLPVVILLFVFFPRMAPLWSVPLVSSQARTGISDTMRPGDISGLAQSSDRAFRVTFGGQMPVYPDRYWRGLVLDYLDGETWRQGRTDPPRRPGRVAIDGGIGDLASDQYDVLLEPTDQRWAFALEGSRPVSDNVLEVAEDLFRFRRPADTAVRYRLELEGAGAVTRTQLPAFERRRNLQLPAEGNPRSRQLARDLAARHDDAGVVRALLSRFRQQDYFYTLRPPVMPDNGIDALLFDARRGFCAHYAGATTFVLRAAGIPARVVVGYQGGEPGAGGDYLIVRQYDAHAWVEAWLEGRGWVRVDPTAAIAPERIESGLRDAVAEEGSFLENDWASPQKYGDVAIIRWASLQMDRLNYQWQRWVVGYQGQSQMDLMSRIAGGIGLKELGYITAGIISSALLLAALVSLWRMRSAGATDACGRMLRRWYRMCRRAGVQVNADDTPAALAARVSRVAPGAADSARLFARMVNSHYYSPASDTMNHEDLRRMRRLLVTMKRQLQGSISSQETIVRD